MEKAVNINSIVPVRASANDRSEMVTQLLFGELVEIQEYGKKWSFIKTIFDNYEGWIDTKQLSIIDEKEAQRLFASESFYTKELITPVYDLETKQELQLLFGSHLIGYSNGKLSFMNRDFIIRESPISLKINKSREAILNNAKKFLGAPYLWGGKMPFGIDCSGFSQVIFKVCGINIPRDASQQAQLGEMVDFVGDAKPGDLAFFENQNGQVIHVGIILNQEKIIHASGSVRIDSFDHNGIYNVGLNEYTHKLRFIKSFL